MISPITVARVTIMTGLLLSLFVGCKEDESNPAGGNNPPPSSQIYPLKSGNRWIFSSQRVNPDTVTVSLITVNDRQVYHLLGEDDLNFFTGGSNSGLFYQANDLWAVYGGVEQLLIPQTRSVGTTSYPHVTDTLSTDTLSVVSTNDQIIVPAGTFQCYQYKLVWYQGANVYNYWIADGVGIVKLYRQRSGGTTNTYELVSYIVN
ncbi:MAG: hypothetical protein AB1847_23130 [bacterium]